MTDTRRGGAGGSPVPSVAGAKASTAEGLAARRGPATINLVDVPALSRAQGRILAVIEGLAIGAVVGTWLAWVR